MSSSLAFPLVAAFVVMLLSSITPTAAMGIRPFASHVCHVSCANTNAVDSISFTQRGPSTQEAPVPVSTSFRESLYVPIQPSLGGWRPAADPGKNSEDGTGSTAVVLPPWAERTLDYGPRERYRRPGAAPRPDVEEPSSADVDPGSRPVPGSWAERVQNEKKWDGTRDGPQKTIPLP